ncbi:MAG: DUF1552 domain-containing protein, partial [Acidobacteriota bacterium]|nr:DUF1552 domain-containing protein [Acidobacteriota bacterium]
RHDRGWVHAWTGNNADFGARDTRSTSASLDQLVAAHVARADRLPSLEVSVDAALEAGRPISYNSGGVRLPAENTPLRAWNRVFGPASSGDTVGAYRRSTLDFAYQEYRAVAARFDANDRARLESHFGLVDRLGHRLEGLATLSCDAPPRPAASFDRYDLQFDAFADIIAAAFSCDITRVVSFSMTHYAAYHGQQVARLVSILESIPDAGGGSLMDNTLIVWGSELGDGWHGYRNYCPVVIGGSWAFDTGRYLYWPHETPAQMRVPNQVAPGGLTQFAGVPHQHFLVSIARAMGLEVDHVGLRHAYGQRGDFIDLAGPLAGLTA